MEQEAVRVRDRIKSGSRDCSVNDVTVAAGDLVLLHPSLIRAPIVIVLEIELLFEGGQGSKARDRHN